MVCPSICLESSYTDRHTDRHEHAHQSKGTAYVVLTHSMSISGGSALPSTEWEEGREGRGGRGGKGGKGGESDYTHRDRKADEEDGHVTSLMT